MTSTKGTTMDKTEYHKLLAEMIALKAEIEVAEKRGDGEMVSIRMDRLQHLALDAIAFGSFTPTQCRKIALMALSSLADIVMSA